MPCGLFETLRVQTPCLSWLIQEPITVKNWSLLSSHLRRPPLSIPTLPLLDIVGTSIWHAATSYLVQTLLPLADWD
jgi:hypothetical protein